MISIKSPRAGELPRGHLIALMTNDSRRSVTRRRPKIGSGEAAAPHSTPWGCPFASSRNRPDVASFHVPHPHVCGPQSHWDRWTSVHIRGARGPLRWKFHHRPLKYSCGDTVSSPLEELGFLQSLSLLAKVQATGYPLQLATSDKKVHSKSTTLRTCLLYTSPSPRDGLLSRMPSSA